MVMGKLIIHMGKTKTMFPTSHLVQNQFLGINTVNKNFGREVVSLPILCYNGMGDEIRKMK